MESDKLDLDFAYKYPFSSEAKEVISKEHGPLNESLIKMGKTRLEEDLNANDIKFSHTTINDIKRTYVLSYVYSRMLISAINKPLFLEKYVRAEARRSRGALEGDSLPNIIKLLSELNINVSYSEGRFVIPLPKYLMVSSHIPELGLSRQELEKGLVYLDKGRILAFSESAIAHDIRKKLPISLSELPKGIIDESKTVKLPKLSLNIEIKEGSYRWIEKILSNPIEDVRHRTVNLILAPYLTNIKGMSEDDAAGIILAYIEKCKELNPDTKVNSSYVKYQCRYAKSKGMKPLSKEKARELYRGIIDLD
jgi:hypothetical protein